MVAAERFLTRGRRAGAIQPSIRGEGEQGLARLSQQALAQNVCRGDVLCDKSVPVSSSQRRGVP